MTRVDHIIALMMKAWQLTSPIVGITPRPVAAAIEQACSEKPLFAGSDGWRESAAMMTAIARFESGFVADAKGDCKDKPPGWPGCGKDNGSIPTSFCFMQIHLPDGQRTAEGWTADDLLRDPLKCARAGREIIRRSIVAGPPGEPLKVYAGSSRLGATRFNLAKQLYQLVPFTPDGGAM